jgi:AraC-like DNA-binding protein
VSEAPWRGGTVYLYRGLDFPEDFQSKPFTPDYPIKPIARMNVFPADWPMLDRVDGADMIAQIERQWDTFAGYPWRDDPDIHPGLWKRPAAEVMRAHIDSNYSEPLGLAEFGKLVDASPYAALRLFRAVMGESPREYQTRSRISKAKDQLRRGLAIGEVAADTGFCDQTHLTRHFRRIVGLTPGRYLRAQEYPIHSR